MEKVEFDLDAIDTKRYSEEGVDLPLKLPNGKPLLNRHDKQVTLRLLGPDSSQYRTLTREQVRKRLKEAKENSSKEEDGFEVADRDSLDVLEACTLGWTHLLGKDGQPVPFTKAAARGLYMQYPAIREQAEVFIMNRVNFLPPSSGS